MSLTSILNNERGRINLKKWFQYNFPNPGIKNLSDIKVPSNNIAFSAELGTAIDYLIRFNLERLNSKYTNNKKNWVAKNGLIAIIYKYKEISSVEISIGFHNSRKVNRKYFLNYLLTRYSKAEKDYELFLKNGKTTNSLLESAVFLAKLDVMVRAGIVEENLDKIEKTKIIELKKMLAIVPWNEFIAKNSCLLNPTFGDGSRAVRGADADFIIDDTLYDIKSSKYLKIERRDLNQIIGYHLLSIIGHNNDKKVPKIKNVAIYFARYGVIWKFPIDYEYDKNDFETLAFEFRELIHDPELDIVPKKVKTKHKLSFKATYNIDENDFKCPYCDSKNFTRHGKETSGKYRYHCKSCSKNYSSIIKTSASLEALKLTK